MRRRMGGAYIETASSLFCDEAVHPTFMCSNAFLIQYAVTVGAEEAVIENVALLFEMLVSVMP
jgi:hypothetical protein